MSTCRALGFGIRHSFEDGAWINDRAIAPMLNSKSYLPRNSWRFLLAAVKSRETYSIVLLRNPLRDRSRWFVVRIRRLRLGPKSLGHMAEVHSDTDPGR